MSVIAGRGPWSPAIDRAGSFDTGSRYSPASGGVPLFHLHRGTAKERVQRYACKKLSSERCKSSHNGRPILWALPAIQRAFLLVQQNYPLTSQYWMQTNWNERWSPNLIQCLGYTVVNRAKVMGFVVIARVVAVNIGQLLNQWVRVTFY